MLLSTIEVGLPAPGIVTRTTQISSCVVLRLAVIAMLLSVSTRVAGQQVQPLPEQAPKVLDLVNKVVPLSFTVMDLGGKQQQTAGQVQDLEVKETAQEVHLQIASDVLFDFDKAELLPKAQQTLLQVAQIIGEKAKGVVRIEGYTDAKGSDDYNLRLSQRRAEAVRKWLTTQGQLARTQFTIAGFGAKNPVAPNQKSDGSDDPIGRQKNRRVEIILKK